MQFTPLVGLAGGAVLGLAAFGKYVINGRVLGISGETVLCVSALRCAGQCRRLQTSRSCVEMVAVRGLLQRGRVPVTENIGLPCHDATGNPRASISTGGIKGWLTVRPLAQGVCCSSLPAWPGRPESRQYSLACGPRPTTTRSQNPPCLSLQRRSSGPCHVSRPHQGDWRSWRVAFNGGLLAAAMVAGFITPAAFDTLPASYTVCPPHPRCPRLVMQRDAFRSSRADCCCWSHRQWTQHGHTCAQPLPPPLRAGGSAQVERAALGGLLVGLGASVGNGCTSGHGICGNARLSARCLLARIGKRGQAFKHRTQTQGHSKVCLHLPAWLLRYRGLLSPSTPASCLLLGPSSSFVTGPSRTR
jgi:hypothetical protein